MNKIPWGILSTGRIARSFAKALKGSRTGELYAVGSRSLDSAERFGREFGARRWYGSYDDLLSDAEVQAVYIATPHPMHAEWTIKAAKARKHILCEKPLTLNHGQAVSVIEAARANDVFLMEAFMYRCHPQTERLVKLLSAKAIGEVALIQASFSFKTDFDLESRLLKNSLGGGGILDVGCYCVSMARLVAGVSTGSDFAEPLEVKGLAHIGEESAVDERAVAVMKFPGEILAVLSTGVLLQGENAVRIFGSTGSIHIPSPWLPSMGGGTTSIFVSREGGKEPEEIRITTDAGLYTIEADTVAASIERRQAPPPAMSWEDTLGNMRALDLWRQSIGMAYDQETATGPVAGA